MKIFKHLASLLLILLAVFSLLSVPSYAADASDDSGSNAEAPVEAEEYSYQYEEADHQVAIYVSADSAAAASVDLIDAFRLASAHHAHIYISVGRVKLFVSGKTVREIAAEDRAVMLYIEKLEPEAQEPSESESRSSTDGEEAPEDALYSISLGGFSFSECDVRVQIKYTTDNADAVRVLQLLENGTEFALRSTCDGKLLSFLPVCDSFTVRITEEPEEPGMSKIMLLLGVILLLLLILSVVLVVLLATGVLQRLILARSSGTSDPSPTDPK